MLAGWSSVHQCTALDHRNQESPEVDPWRLGSPRTHRPLRCWCSRWICACSRWRLCDLRADRQGVRAGTDYRLLSCVQLHAFYLTLLSRFSLPLWRLQCPLSRLSRSSLTSCSSSLSAVSASPASRRARCLPPSPPYNHLT
jgi:hypothetical protein